MTEPAAPPARVLPAATMLLLRDGDSGLQVFMVQRHHAIDFASGALVFPGGKVAEGDVDEALAGHCTGGEALSPELRAFAIAALRETFEESGILLAREEGGAIVGPERLEGMQSWRTRLDGGEAGMHAFAAAERLRLALDLLMPFAHWITPLGMPKRFDTWFFLAAAPEKQLARHDGRESVDSVWINPAQALSEAESGSRTIVFATRMQLAKLATHATAAAALAAARRDPIVTVQPQIDREARVLRIPREAGYGITEVSLDGVSR